MTADEIYVEGKEIYRISLEQGTEVRTAESGEDFFEALKELRQELEKNGALLHCFGASENVYPSGMQIDGACGFGLQDAPRLPNFTTGHCQHL
jgi:hypothetical protein